MRHLPCLFFFRRRLLLLIDELKAFVGLLHAPLKLKGPLKALHFLLIAQSFLVVSLATLGQRQVELALILFLALLFFSRCFQRLFFFLLLLLPHLLILLNLMAHCRNLLPLSRHPFLMFFFLFCHLSRLRL